MTCHEFENVSIVMSMLTLIQVPLSKTAVRPKFLCLQLVLIVSGIQRFVFGIFVVSAVIPCYPPLSAQGNADSQLLCAPYVISNEISYDVHL